MWGAAAPCMWLADATSGWVALAVALQLLGHICRAGNGSEQLCSDGVPRATE